MIIYESTVREFIADCDSKRIADAVVDKMKLKLGMSVSPSEKNAYAASLPVVASALRHSKVSPEAGVGVEYRIRFGKARIDFLIYGLDEKNCKNVVVVELKQWSSVYRSGKPNHIYAQTHGGVKEDHCHPSIQATNYIGQLRNFNQFIQDNAVALHACSYLHNMPEINEIILMDKDEFPVVLTSPAFLKDDVNKLVDFIDRYVKTPCPDILYMIDHSEIRPSAHLSATLGQALKGNQFFAYDDYQENAISEIVRQVYDVLDYNERRVIIVKGAPGTGKSVVAMNVLGQLMNSKKRKNINAAYFAVNSALRTLYTKELIGDDYKKGFIKGLLKYPTVLKDAPAMSFDCGLFDEAHRLFDFKGGTGMSKGQHLLKSAINACRVSVFFVDGDQRVTTIDYATEENIRKVADELKIRVDSRTTLELTAQYRCLGGDEYLEFVRNVLGYKKERTTFDFGPYEFEVFDDPEEMFARIREKDLEFQKASLEGNGKIFVPGLVSGRCRVVAGYTHNWVSKKQNRTGPDFDFSYKGGAFKKKWNLRCAGLPSNYSWLDDPESIEEIGCIHTCQGLDLNYCGVIIGKDLRYEDGHLVFDKKQNAKTDTASQIHNADDALAEILIRNTYNVLLTRGMKGTFVYCEDPALAEYIRSFAFRHLDQ